MGDSCCTCACPTEQSQGRFSALPTVLATLKPQGSCTTLPVVHRVCRPYPPCGAASQRGAVDALSSCLGFGREAISERPAKPSSESGCIEGQEVQFLFPLIWFCPIVQRCTLPTLYFRI